MTTNADPIHVLTSTYDVSDLAALTAGSGPFLSMVLAAPSEHFDAAHRLDVRWRNARRDAAADWSESALAALDGVVADLGHGEGEALAIYQRADGETLATFLSNGVTSQITGVADHPRLVPVIEDRQRTLPHVVVVTDRAGADIAAFDGGSMVASDHVEGDTEHIHRGHPGGWSQRRFQQRAENTWERNADDVAESVAGLAERVGAVMIAVAGEVRARTLVVDALSDERAVQAEVVSIEAGDTEGISAETLRLLDDRHARFQVAALDALRSSDGVLAAADVLGALEEGRVETLFVNDLSSVRADGDDRGVGVDRAVAAALRTDARIIVVPKTAELTDGLAAITRW